MKYYQQGDVVLKQVTIPTGKREYKANLVLAEGETTGHSHRIVFQGNTVSLAPQKESKTQPQIRMFTIGGKTYVEAPDAFAVVHEEHNKIEVPAGDYEIHIVREYDHFAEEARNVAD